MHHAVFTVIREPSHRGLNLHDAGGQAGTRALRAAAYEVTGGYLSEGLSG